MAQYQWMVTPEKCGNFWKVAVQTTDGAVYFSNTTYIHQEKAFEVAVKIYQEGEFVSNQFTFDYQN